MGFAVDQSPKVENCESLIRRKTVGARETRSRLVATLLLIEDSCSHPSCLEQPTT